tara:strand:+ start:357 stop:728 length:372 start_codon:yes stop_codon:yes gene_type:complete
MIENMIGYSSTMSRPKNVIKKVPMTLAVDPRGNAEVLPAPVVLGAALFKPNPDKPADPGVPATGSVNASFAEGVKAPKTVGVIEPSVVLSMWIGFGVALVTESARRDRERRLEWLFSPHIFHD